MKMIIDFADSSVSFKAHPQKWYVLPKTPTRLLLLPVTEKAIERHNFHTSFVANIYVVSFVVVLSKNNHRPEIRTMTKTPLNISLKRFA